MMSLLTYLGQEAVGATLRASLLILFIFAARPLLVRWLPLKFLPWLWLLVAIKLLLISAPGGWWSLYNLGHLFRVIPARQDFGALPVVTNSTLPEPPIPSMAAVGETWSWLSLLSLIWLFGAVLLAVAQIITCIRFHRQLAREEQVVNSPWQRVLDECVGMAGLKTAPPLIETHVLDSLAVIGLWRPRLLMPHGLLDRLEPAEVRLVFIHELSHLRRHDLWLLTLFAVVRTIHWFNPLVWLAERALRADCEAACDAEVLQLTSSSSQGYGQVLLRLTQLGSGRRASILVASISTNSNQTERRLQMIMRYQKSSGWVSVAAFALAATTGVLTLPNEVTAQEQLAAGAPTPPITDSTHPDLAQKLKSISLSVDFNNATIEEALKFLSAESKNRDPDHKGVHFIISPAASSSAKPISLSLKDVSLGEALSYVCQLTGVKSSVQDYAVRILASNEPDVIPSGPKSAADDLSVQPDDASGQATAGKLKSIIIDKIDFHQVDVAVALQFFAQKSKELDPEKKGINFVLGEITPQDLAGAPANHIWPIHRQFSVTLENVPLADLLDYVTQQTNLKWSIKGSEVYFHPAGDSSTKAQPAAVKPTTNVAPTAPRPGIAALQHKLDATMIDKIDFNKTDIVDVIQLLTRKSKEFDPDKEGVNFVLRADVTAQDHIHREITLNMENVPLGKVLDELARQTNFRYSVDDCAVYLRPAGEVADMLTVRTFLAPSGFLKIPPQALAANPVYWDNKQIFRVDQQLADLGMRFPKDSSAMLLVDSNKLVVRNTPEQLDLLAKLIDQASH